MTGWFRFSFHESQPVDLWNRKTKTCCTQLHDITKKAVPERRHGCPRVMVLHALRDARRLFAYKHNTRTYSRTFRTHSSSNRAASSRAAGTGDQVSITVHITPPPSLSLTWTGRQSKPVLCGILASVGRTQKQDHRNENRELGRVLY